MTVFCRLLLRIRVARFAHEAEIFACECLSKGSDLLRSDVEHLYDLLPVDSSSPREDLGKSGTSFITGAYSKGGIVGLRFNTRAFPASTALLFITFGKCCPILRVAQLLFLRTP